MIMIMKGLIFMVSKILYQEKLRFITGKAIIITGTKAAMLLILLRQF